MADNNNEQAYAVARDASSIKALIGNKCHRLRKVDVQDLQVFPSMIIEVDYFHNHNKINLLYIFILAYATIIYINNNLS